MDGIRFIVQVSRMISVLNWCNPVVGNLMTLVLDKSLSDEQRAVWIQTVIQVFHYYRIRMVCKLNKNYDQSCWRENTHSLMRFLRFWKAFGWMKVSSLFPLSELIIERMKLLETTFMSKNK